MHAKLAARNLIIAMLSGCQGGFELEHPEQSFSVEQRGLHELRFSVGPGWISTNHGTAEKQTAQGGKLVLAYNQEGLIRMSSDFEKLISNAEKAPATSRDSKQISRLRNGLAQLQQLNFSDMPQNPSDVSCPSIKLNLTGEEKCGCNGTSPVFSIKAQAIWTNCFKLNGRAEACIDGTCNVTTRTNKETGTIVSYIDDTGSVGTTLLGMRSGKLWGTDPSDASSTVNVSVNIPVTCTFPDCTPATPPFVDCSCYDYEIRTCHAVYSNGDGCYICSNQLPEQLCDLDDRSTTCGAVGACP